MELVDDGTLSVLEELTKANIDRLESYQRAQRDTDDEALKSVFGRYASQSEQFRSELSTTLTTLGGRVPGDSSFSGVMQQAWMEFKAGLSGNNAEILLDSCAQSESTILGVYRRVLGTEEPLQLSPSLRELIERQATQLTAAQAHIHSLRRASNSFNNP